MISIKVNELFLHVFISGLSKNKRTYGYFKYNITAPKTEIVFE